MLRLYYYQHRTILLIVESLCMIAYVPYHHTITITVLLHLVYAVVQDALSTVGSSCLCGVGAPQFRGTRGNTLPSSYRELEPRQGKPTQTDRDC